MKRTIKVEQTNQNDRYAEFGMASIIPGFQIAIDLLQEQLDNIRTQLAAAQGAQVPVVKAWATKRAAALVNGLTKPIKWHPRDPNHPGHATWVEKIRQARAKSGRRSRSTGVKGYWANMTPEERSAEMARRMKVAGKKRLAKVGLKKEAAA